MEKTNNIENKNRIDKTDKIIMLLNNRQIYPGNCLLS